MNSTSIFRFNRTDNFPVFEHSQRRYLIWKWLGRRFALRGLLFHTLLSVETHHMELIPASGPTLLMMNHQGGIDPVVLMGAVGPRYLCVMSKIENFRIPVIARLIRLWGSYPIRRGIIDRRALDYTLRL